MAFVALLEDEMDSHCRRCGFCGSSQMLTWGWRMRSRGRTNGWERHVTLTWTQHTSRVTALGQGHCLGSESSLWQEIVALGVHSFVRVVEDIFPITRIELPFCHDIFLPFSYHKWSWCQTRSSVCTGRSDFWIKLEKYSQQRWRSLVHLMYGHCVWTMCWVLGEIMPRYPFCSLPRVSVLLDEWTLKMSTEQVFNCKLWWALSRQREWCREKEERGIPAFRERIRRALGCRRVS